MVDKEKLLKDLQGKAKKWVKEQLPQRMQEVGAAEDEVRKQLETEADQWIQYNLDQRAKGKEGSPSPDFKMHGVRPELDPVQRTGVTEKPPTWDEEKK